MVVTHFQDMFAYNFWMHRQVWSCIEQLTDEQFESDLDYSIGSLKEQCIHTMGVEYWWFHFLTTGELDFLEVEKLTDRAAIRSCWDGVEAQVTAYLAELKPEGLAQPVKPPFWEAHHAPVLVTQALFQIANHSTDHRAQILAGLYRLGGPTIEQDYLEYHFAKDGAGHG
jgi:uncharacterized damage-inducible protein DinB